MKRSALLYFLILAVAGLGLFGILRLGGKEAPPPGVAPVAAAVIPAPPMVSGVWAGLQRNTGDPLARLFLQLILIVGAARAAGWAFSRCGQPAVIGEMAAGILLGPSFFGLVAPGAFGFVFSKDSLGALQLFSQIGVCLFMFVVGMELDLAQIRKKAHTAVLVSHASIIIPCLMGAALALFLYRDFAQPGASFTAFGLFMGTSMSITAFPVLASILRERNLTRTPLGVAAIACAAVDDVTAWTILAFVVAVARATSLAATGCILLLVGLLVVLMLGVVKPELPRWLGGKAVLEQEEPGGGRLAIVIIVVMASALATQVIGIHAIFGAFLAGAVMPAAGDFRQKLSVRVAGFSSVLLLPIFFAFTGLRTQLGLLHGTQEWLICAGIIAVATLGKFGGTAVTARLAGMGWQESLQLGALMNTRGLMELIALNVGYDLGILSPRIFTMMVIMALATTAMTGPLLTLFSRARQIDGAGLKTVSV